MNKIYCRHYLLKDNKLKKYNDFKIYFENIKYNNYIIKNHIYINVLDTIHYKVLNNEIPYSLYEKYIKLTNQKEHLNNSYKKLINTFNIKNFGKIKVKKEKNNCFVVYDGCHRLSILKYNNYKNINDYIQII